MLDEQRYATASDLNAVDVCHSTKGDVIEHVKQGLTTIGRASRSRLCTDCCTSGILEDVMTVPMACSLTAWHLAASRLGEGRRQSNCLTRGIIYDIQHLGSFEA